MASLRDEQQISSNSQTAEQIQKDESREGSIERKAKDRDDKLKLARDRQNEERQRKIEELKIHAEAAQKYREQKEEERRRRIEEVRNRELEKRQQVEERKRVIMEAEKERREYILRKNQERDSRLESKKRERNSFGFAFGSSTPRLLEPADFGLVSTSTFWGQRRSTSISNVAGATLSRRSSERELTDSSAKKRATSASGTDHRHEGSRSGNVTPGGSGTSRPGSAMSTSTNISTSGYVNKRTGTTPRKPRPASIAGTGVSLEEINKLKRENKPPLKSSSAPSADAQMTPRRSTNVMSTSMYVTTTPPSHVANVEKRIPSKREPVTPKVLLKTSSSDRLNKFNKDKPRDVVSIMTKSAIVIPTSSFSINTIVPTELMNSAISSKNKDDNTSTKVDVTILHQVSPEPLVSKETEVVVVINEENIEPVKEIPNSESESADIVKKVQNNSKENSDVREHTPPSQTESNTNDMMTASMIAKKITTEEEAKAALAERRRLAREEAERQAELERQRIEAGRIAEIKRQEEEVEQQRQFEEEAMRLAEEQRKAEELRLRQAIEEAKQREEEEYRKRLEEEQQRVEREEAEKKAKEEAEKLRLEVAERLKREEKEREERRKRVEAIMSRTRKTGSTNNSTIVKENSETNKITSNDAQMPLLSQTQPLQQSTATSNSDSNSTSGSTTTTTTPTPMPNQIAVVISEQQNSQAMYEQSVIDKETALINSFSNMIIDENAKNRQHQQQIIDVSNGKLHTDFPNSDVILQTTTATTTTTVANGNGHIENINNKNDINILQDVTGGTNQLIDFSIESQEINNAVNFNNNNSLLTTTTATLVTADSHENKEVSLL